jgi:hypothetical protein
MIVYNVTIKIDEAVSEEWLQWLVQEHIPDVMATQCFTEYKLLRLLDVDDSQGPTYTVQYFAANEKDYDRYINEFAAALRNKTLEKWGDQFVAFRSLMSVVQ